MKSLYKKIVSIIGNIGVDKYLHFIVCQLLATVILSLCLFLNAHIWLASVIAFCVTIIIGILKEAYDKHDYGLFSTSDLIADILGAAIGVLSGLLVWIPIALL